MRVLGIPIRVAGASHGNLNYLVNLALCLKRFGTRWQPTVLTSPALLPPASLELLKSSGTTILNLPYFADRPTAARFLRGLVGGDADVRATSKSAHLDCLFENAAFYGRRPTVPILHWIPDLQHRELPQMFPLAARLRRELLIRCALISNRTILMSSAAARDSMLQQYSVDPSRLHVARFASLLIGGDGDMHADSVTLGQLRVSGPFAFVPNQFWRHKNHLILPRAAKKLAERGMSLTFVCTGEQSDPRSSEHFAAFNRLLDECGVRDRFIMPGLVPYATVRSLHRQCAMLVNPSFVEGWNTGVEEAKFLGSRLVLSDMGTHREQVLNYPRAKLFDPNNAVALADAISETLKSGPVSREDRQVASARYDENIRQFVDAVELALDRTTGEFGSRICQNHAFK